MLNKQEASPFDLFHVRATKERPKSGMEKRLEEDKDLIADNLLTHREQEEKQQRLKEEATRRAYARAKPFLETLFDDLESRNVTTDASQTLEEQSKAFFTVPSQRYCDHVAREAAKPQILQFVVSTDNCPLPTKTSQVTYMAFSTSNLIQNVHAPHTNHLNNRQSTLRGSEGTLFMRRTRDAVSGLSGAPLSFMRDVGAGGEAEGSGGMRKVYRADTSCYDEDANLSNAHLLDLMQTIQEAKLEAIRNPHRAWS